MHTYIYICVVPEEHARRSRVYSGQGLPPFVCMYVYTYLYTYMRMYKYIYVYTHADIS